MTQEVMRKEEQEIIQVDTKVDEKDLPILLSEQMTKLTKLDESIKKAINAAKKAGKSAKKAKEQSAGLFQKKKAIEELKTANYDLAKAVQSGTEAQQVSFEFQTQLAEISKYLFSLGVSNIASNRYVVRELELRLQGATDEQLSNLAKQELLAVVRQLKEQEDLLLKIERVTTYVKEHDNALQDQTKINRKIDTSITNLFDAKQQNEIDWTKQREENEQIKVLLTKQTEKDAELENRIDNHQAQLEVHRSSHKEHREALERHELVQEEHTEKLITQHEAINMLQEETKRIEAIQQTHAQTLQTHTNELMAHENTLQLHTNKLTEHENIHKEHTSELKKQNERLLTHEKLLQNKRQILAEHETTLEALQQLTATMETKHTDHVEQSKRKLQLIDEQLIFHDEQLNDLTKTDEQLAEKTTANEQVLADQAAEIKSLEEKIESLKEELATKTNQKMTNVVLGSVIVTFILSILHFFL